MKCEQVQDWLIEHITAAGVKPAGDIDAHLETCQSCRGYYRELLALSDSLEPLKDISMTADESTELASRVTAAISDAGTWNTYLRPERKIYTVARAAAAIVAMILIVLISSGKQTTDETSPPYSIDDFDLSYTSVEDLAPLFVNGEQDYLPSLVDEEKAAYLTDQVLPAEAEEILESATGEEIEWLMANYSLEI